MRRTGEEDAGDLAQDAEENEEAAAEAPRVAVRAARDGDHAVVLREDRQRRDGEERGDEAADAVGLRRDTLNFFLIFRVAEHAPRHRLGCASRIPVRRLRRVTPRPRL